MVEFYRNRLESLSSEMRSHQNQTGSGDTLAVIERRLVISNRNERSEETGSCIITEKAGKSIWS